MAEGVEEMERGFNKVKVVFAHLQEDNKRLEKLIETSEADWIEEKKRTGTITNNELNKYSKAYRIHGQTLTIKRKNRNKFERTVPTA